MFYPQKMTEVEIIVPAKDLLPVTRALSGQGVFSQTDVNYLSSDKNNANANQWQEKASAYSILERRVQSITQALDVKQLPMKKHEQADPLDVESTRLTVDEIEREVKSLVEGINAENKNIEHLGSMLQQLTALSTVNLDFSQMNGSRYIHSILGMMPHDNIDRLRTSLSRIPFVLYVLSQQQQKAVVWLAASSENAEVLNRASKSAYLDPLNLPEGMKGTPAQLIDSINVSIAESKAKIVKLQEQIQKVRDDRQEQVADLLWDLRSSHMTMNAIGRYGKLKYTYVIVGWLYSNYLPGLKENLRKISSEVIIEARNADRSKESNEVPVALNNPSLFRPFQSTVTTYAQPKYNELDPTPLVAILFPLLFGAMFGDVGHGALIAIFGALVMSKKVKFLRMFGGLGPVLLACGISATIFGFLYGSVMGYEEILHPLWLAPTKSIMSILIIAIGAGVIVLVMGFLTNIYNMLRIKNFAHAFFGHNGFIGLGLYLSLIGWALPIVGTIFPIPAALSNLPLPKNFFMILLLAFAALVMFSEVFIRLIEGHRPLVDGGVGIYFAQAFFELFEVLISFLSNSLSFVRVGAFAVAHGNLAAVFFILAKMVGPNGGVGYWIMYLVGLVFIVGFEGLIVYIQTTRLTYYETFGKFFTGGGKQFEPLSIKPADNEI
jgi:V/A-type H+/Na+-transporting ATPase subunit I